jgi:hypothetical protein
MDLKDKYFFVLGGVDNEMEEIKSILEKKNIGFVQPQLNWGDIVVTRYSLPANVETTHTIVFVECNPASDIKGKIVLIDHHGQSFNKQPSLIQVAKLLKIKLTIRQQIVASIDASFLKQTIRKFPKQRKAVIKIWRDGYKKKFKTEEEWLMFEKHCRVLWENAKQRNRIAKNTAIVWNAPPSMTMIGAMADLDGWACLLICGSPTTHRPVPIFFQGNKKVIEFLSQLELEKWYRGRRYFGCREIPKKAVELVESALAVRI